MNRNLYPPRNNSQQRNRKVPGNYEQYNSNNQYERQQQENYNGEKQISPDKSNLAKLRQTNPHYDGGDLNNFSPTLLKNIDLDDLIDKKENPVLEKKLKVLENNAKFFEAQAQPLFLENSQLKDQIIEINEMVRERTKEFSSLVREYDEKGQTRDLIKKIGDLEAIFAVLKEDCTYYNTKIYGLCDETDRLNSKIKELDNKLFEECLRNKKETELMKTDFNNQLEILNERVRDMGKVNEDLENLLLKERKEKEIMLRDKNQDIQNLNNNISDLNEKMKNQELDFNNQKRNLESIILQNKERFLKEKKDIIDRNEQVIRELKENYESKIAKLTDQYESKLRLLKEELRQKTERLQLLQDDYDRLRNDSTLEIDQLRKKLDQERDENQRFRGSLNDTHKEISILLKHKEELEMERDKLLKELESKSKELMKLESEYDEYRRQAEEQIVNLKRQIREYQENMKLKEESWRQRFENQAIENEMKMRENVRDLTMKYEEQLKVLREELEKNMSLLDKEKNELIRQLNLKIAEMGEEYSILKRKYDTETKDWSQRFEELEDKMRRRIQEDEYQFNETIKKLQNKLKEDLENAEKRRKDEIAQITKIKTQEYDEMLETKNKQINDQENKYESQIKEIKTSLTNKYNDTVKMYDEQIKDLKENLEVQKQMFEDIKRRELSEQKEKYEAELKRLKDLLEGSAQDMVQEVKELHRKEIENLITKYEDKILKIQEEWERKHSQAIESYEQQLKKLKLELEKETQDHNATKEKLKIQLEKYKQDTDEYKLTLAQQKQNFEKIIYENNKNIKELEETIQKLTQQLENEKMQYEKKFEEQNVEINKWKTQFNEFENILRKKLEAELNKALQEQIEFIEKMKQEHHLLLEAHKRKNMDLQKGFNEVEKLFGERPSRPDDIRHIKSLLKDIENMKSVVNESETKVVHANEIVKYLQLELENYKNVYDIFGQQKQVPGNDSMISGVSGGNRNQLQLIQQQNQFISPAGSQQQASQFQSQNPQQDLRLGKVGQQRGKQNLSLVAGNRGGSIIQTEVSQLEENQLSLGGGKSLYKKQLINPVQKTSQNQSQLPQVVDNKYQKYGRKDRSLTQANGQNQSIQSNNPLDNSEILKNADKMVTQLGEVGFANIQINAPNNRNILAGEAQKAQWSAINNFQNNYNQQRQQLNSQNNSRKNAESVDDEIEDEYHRQKHSLSKIGNQNFILKGIEDLKNSFSQNSNSLRNSAHDEPKQSPQTNKKKINESLISNGSIQNKTNSVQETDSFSTEQKLLNALNNSSLANHKSQDNSFKQYLPKKSNLLQ